MVGNTSKLEKAVHKTKIAPGLQFFVHPPISEPFEPIPSDPARNSDLYLFLYPPIRWTHGGDRVSHHGAIGAKQSDCRTYPRVPILEGDPFIQSNVLDYCQLDESLHGHRLA